MNGVVLLVGGLIQPPRGVLDIHMGNYASGGR